MRRRDAVVSGSQQQLPAESVSQPNVPVHTMEYDTRDWRLSPSDHGQKDLGSSSECIQPVVTSSGTFQRSYAPFLSEDPSISQDQYPGVFQVNLYHFLNASS